MVCFTVESCKAAWRSLKDAFNYRSKAKKGKSGDPADFDDPETGEPSVDQDKTIRLWEHWDDMKFLHEESPVRMYGFLI